MLIFCSGYSQSKKQHAKFAQAIDCSDLKNTIYYLASEGLEGRKTGERGQQIAANYIRSQFKAIGLKPLEQYSNYYQQFNLIKSSPQIVQLSIEGSNLEINKDFLYQGEGNMMKAKQSEVVFLGNGTDEIRNSIDFKGKAVAINYANMESLYKIEKVQKEGASIVFVIIDQRLTEYKANISVPLLRPTFIKRLSGHDKKEGIFYITKSIATKIFGCSQQALKSSKLEEVIKVQPVSFEYFIQREEQNINTQNVLGYIEGSDYSDEYIIITAHYDHEGIQFGKLMPGADDNASGVAALLEIAEAFQYAESLGFRPKKSILFIAFTGEEQGIYGSDYFVNHSDIMNKHVVSNLNIDMLGRVDPEYMDYENYIYLIGADKLSNELHKISEQANQEYVGLDLDYSFNDINHPDQIYYRSDQWSFAKNNIPVIFYYAGEHDDYHRPTDTPDKINYPILAKRTKLIFHTAWELANTSTRLKLD